MTDDPTEPTDDPIEPPLTSAQRHAATCYRAECLDNPNRPDYRRRLALEQKREADQRELATRFATQPATRTGAIDELVSDLTHHVLRPIVRGDGDEDHR